MLTAEGTRTNYKPTPFPSVEQTAASEDSTRDSTFTWPGQRDEAALVFHHSLLSDWLWQTGTGTFNVDIAWPLCELAGTGALLIQVKCYSDNIGLSDSLPESVKESLIDTNPLYRYLNEVKDWLGIGISQVAEAAGISRATVYAWRDRHRTPRPATVHAVYRLHGLVASSIKMVGVERTKAWFHAGTPSPIQELSKSHGDYEVTRQISKRLRRELVRTPLPPVDHTLAANQRDAAE